MRQVERRGGQWMIGEVMSALAIVTKPADQRTDDVDLVAAVRAGDDRAFEQLFVRYRERITAYVRGMVRDHARAEDITQEVFISALRRLRATETPIAFKPWIYEIAKNACIDAYRRTRNTTEVSFDADDSLGPSIAARHGAPDAVVEGKLAIDNLCGAFGGLSQAHHDILVMREFDDLSYREIGERLGMSRAAVESTLFRARRRLSEEYEELVSGERCLRVRAILDAPAGRAVGTRDRRRMARHVAHCQPCRRHARLAGVDLDGVRAPAAARIAALLPLPAFLRRRFDLDDGGQLLSHHGPALQWSTKVVTVLDPATLSAWPKAIAAAATVAVAGLGAGAAVSHREAIGDVVSKARGATVVPALAPRHAVDERVSRRHAGSRGNGSASLPSGSTADPNGAGDVRDPDRTDPDDAVPTIAEPVPASVSQPAPGGRLESGADSGTSTAPAGQGASGGGVTLPGNELPPVDATSDDDVPTTRPLRDRRERPLRDALGNIVASVDPTLPDAIGDVVSAVESTLVQGGQQNGGVATGTSTTVDPTPATGGPVSSAVGGLLGGAGAGSP
jgi:RNA polymerase sigma factor (sigma-70 family)